jgi:predicted DNA-binding transcriptional regulator YafY
MAGTKTERLFLLAKELNSQRFITKKRAEQILGEKRLSDSTWKRYKHELKKLYSCTLVYDKAANCSRVPKSWTLVPMPRMDPRKRDLLARLRVDLLRLGSPFTNALGPQLDQWESQLSELDPHVKESSPVHQPQPRVSAAFYHNLAACEKGIRDRRVLKFLYTKGDGRRPSTRHILPYDLFDFNGRIYVWGPEEGDEVAKFFALDCITHIEVCEGFAAKKEYDPGYSLDSALRHSFGMFVRPTRPLEVAVKILASRAAEVKARRWPAETSIESFPDGSLLLTFAVTDPRELVAWVMSFCGDARILSPPVAIEMARRFAQRIEAEHPEVADILVEDRLLRFDWQDQPVG